MPPDASPFDLPSRNRLLRRDGAFRRRWPDAAALVDRAVAPFARFVESRLPDRLYVRRQYEEIVGTRLDLDHPETLSEKIQWLKLRDATPLHTRCADKIGARDYVRELRGGDHLIPALLITDRLSDVAPKRIGAERFVAKTNHDWGGVVICRDRASFDWAAARRKLRSHLRRRFWKVNRELAYKDIAPAIIVEACCARRTAAAPATASCSAFTAASH